jgi:hypothetical protein
VFKKKRTKDLLLFKLKKINMIKIIYSIKIFFYIILFLKLIIVKGSKLDIDRIGDTVEVRYEIPLRHRLVVKHYYMMAGVII